MGNCALFPRKRTFDSEALAVDAAAKLSAQIERRIRTYVCPFCGKWHLTSRKRKLSTRHLSPRKLRRLTRMAEERKDRVSSETE